MLLSVEEVTQAFAALLVADESIMILKHDFEGDYERGQIIDLGKQDYKWAAIKTGKECMNHNKKAEKNKALILCHKW